jgi:vacuolar protein sorting-associated protein VTA1
LQEQQEQQILSAPPPQGDSDFHFASESTVAAATLSSYEGPQDEPSSPASNIDLSHQPASSLLSADLGRPHLSWPDPESWSTVATSGIPDPPGLNSANLGLGEISSGNWSDIAAESDGGGVRGIKARSRSGSNSGAIECSGEELPLQRASQEVDTPISSMDILAEPDNKLYFSQISQPPQPPHFGSPTEYHGSLNTHTSSQSPVFSSSRPQVHEAFVQQSPSAVYSRSRAPPPPPPPVPVQEDPVELTPGIITKAQKHCRFAISALNYDDAEQAKKELRAALTLLGG